MYILIFLVPISILIAFSFVMLFIFATKKGQFDDLETPAFKILIDESNKVNQSK